ncbi:hypothetical protein FB567DRAFT_331604 [Paraphoma chrysanthemicola]|uniref:Uncharacterized protein n=1 Tax=Paraphoma chrysanthemicola TaxID=798071 RepID=A0A8K0VYY6_9PLEO|nr:hypothetical protein FB567DRAFT_331604 [Paraphoma chrysanthemicola]
MSKICQPISSKEVFLQSAPRTARDLVAYTKKVESECMYGLPSPEGLINNGKVNPSKYGSVGAKDLGLCYETFLTSKACKHGCECRWRHANLTKEEDEWIQLLGGDCLARMRRHWSSGGSPELTTCFPFCM